MYLNEFSVRIPEGNEQGGYVELSNGQQYKLVLSNRHSVPCDAKVEIDGKDVGTWRIHAYDGITLERPAHDTGHFTFYQVGTPEAAQAALNPGDPDLGLVKVTFTPEKRRPPVNYTPGAYDAPVASGPAASFSMRGAESKGCSGGTGLSGESRQRFVEVGSIEYDYAQQTTIFLRLIARPVGGSDGPRPLTSFSTQIPPRLY